MKMSPKIFEFYLLIGLAEKVELGDFDIFRFSFSSQLFRRLMKFVFLQNTNRD